MAEKKKIALIGGITIDHYLLDDNGQGKAYIDHLIKSSGIILDHSQPKQVSEKVPKLSEEATRNQNFMIGLGGGAYNSLRGLLELERTNNNNNIISYFDLSESPRVHYTNYPSIKLIGVSGHPSVNYLFQGITDITESLVIRENNDRRILKSRRYDKGKLLSDKTKKSLIDLLEESDVIMINSTANYELAEIVGFNYQGDGKEKFVVITKGLEKEELRRSRLVKGSTAIIDFEEASHIVSDLEKEKVKRNRREECVIKPTQNNLEKILYILIDEFGAKNAIVTLGKGGSAYYDRQLRKVCLWRVEDQEERQIQKFLSDYSKQKNGAGDYFAAAILYYMTNGQPIKEAIKKAQMFVVRNLFEYKKGISENFFFEILPCFEDESGLRIA